MKKRVKSLIIKLPDQMKKDFTHVYHNIYSKILSTRLHTVLLYQLEKYSVKDVTRRYKISKASLMRWNKSYDGTKASLFDRSHRPHFTHHNAHTSEKLSNIQNLVKRNSNSTLCKLFGKLRTKHQYQKHLISLHRVLRKIGLFKKI